MAIPPSCSLTLATLAEGDLAESQWGSWPAVSPRRCRASRWLEEAVCSSSQRSSCLITCPGVGLIPRRDERICKEEGGGKAGEGGLLPRGGWRFSTLVTYKVLGNVYLFKMGGRVVAEGGNGSEAVGMPIPIFVFAQTDGGYVWPREDEGGVRRRSVIGATFNAGGRHVRATCALCDVVVQSNGKAGRVRNGFHATDKVPSYAYAGRKVKMRRAAAGCSAEGRDDGDWGDVRGDGDGWCRGHFRRAQGTHSTCQDTSCGTTTTHATCHSYCRTLCCHVTHDHLHCHGRRVVPVLARVCVHGSWADHLVVNTGGRAWGAGVVACQCVHWSRRLV